MSKILNISEEKLSRIYNEFNYFNIVNYWNSSKPYYTIPKELVTKEINISESNYCSPDYDGLVYSGTNWYLNEFTGLTPQEFFDICILHINDTELRPKCPWCGNNLKFSCIPSGYGSSGRKWIDSKNHFCDTSCSSNYVHNNQSEYDLDGYGFGNKRVNILTHRTLFLSYGDFNDDCEFYITIFNGKFKYGVSINSSNRIHCNQSFYKVPESKFKIIFKGTRLEVANLEALVKLNLDEASEYLDFNNTMYKFRKSFIKSLQDLKEGNFEF